MTKVVVQAGHCFRTVGATGAPGEQEFADTTSLLTVKELSNLGYQAVRILADEPSDKYRGDIFVAIHYDSSNNPTASGASVGYQNAEGKKLAELWKQSYINAGWTNGFQNDNYTSNLHWYYGVTHAISVGNKVAIITESGFHSNSSDKSLLDPARTAKSIVDAINKYTGKGIDVLSEEDKATLARIEFEQEAQYKALMYGQVWDAVQHKWIDSPTHQLYSLTTVKTRLDDIEIALSKIANAVGIVA